MKRLFKYIITLILIFSIFVSPTVSAFQISGFELNAKAAMLISLDTGEVLYAKNETAKMYPASITKLLAAVIMVENTPDLDNTKITATKQALTEILGTGASVIGLKEGEELTVRQALYCLLVSSGGDVAYVIAEHYGGSTENFMDMMNKKAAEIGMTASHFGNPVGLHDEQTYTTAADIALLARYALQYDVITEVTSVSRYQLAATNKSAARTLSTTNFLIDPSTNYYYKYASGLKTGFTDQAGRCVVSTASYEGYNYLCIIMNCDSSGGQRNEFVDSRNLYRWAFNNFEYKTLIDTTLPVAEIPVELSFSSDFIQLYPEKSITSILPVQADASTINIVPTLVSETATAPVKAGTVLGTAEIIYAGEVIGKVNLVSRETVKANIILQTGRVLKNIFTSTPFKIILALIVAAVLIFIGACIKLNMKSTKRRKVKYMPYDHRKHK